MSTIVSFYQHKTPDFWGRWLRDIWQWDFEQLEETHNYIQVLFPNFDPSFFNPWACTLDQKTVEAFHKNQSLRDNLNRSLALMIDFYGLEQNAGDQIIKGQHFPERAPYWISPFNHNFLRITRILLCLRALGLAEKARAFFHFLQTVYPEFAEEIGEETLTYWHQAVDPVGK